jgi:hypothetical protein
MSTRLLPGIGVCLVLLAASPVFGNEWAVNDTISPLDGSRTYAATLRSANTIRGSDGSDDLATLVIRCAGGHRESYIAWPQNMGTGSLEMRWKTDSGKVTTESWSASVDGSATFTEGARAFLGKLKGAHQANFQVSLANFDSLQANFNVAGVDDVVDAALAICSR